QAASDREMIGSLAEYRDALDLLRKSVFVECVFRERACRNPRYRRKQTGSRQGRRDHFQRVHRRSSTFIVVVVQTRNPDQIAIKRGARQVELLRYLVCRVEVARHIEQVWNIRAIDMYRKRALR